MHAIIKMTEAQLKAVCPDQPYAGFTSIYSVLKEVKRMDIMASKRVHYCSSCLYVFKQHDKHCPQHPKQSRKKHSKYFLIFDIQRQIEFILQRK